MQKLKRVLRFSKNYISRFIAFVVAFQLLNMSIDAPSAQMSCRSVDDNFNYIDTFTEFVIEDVLHYDNAIPESKDRQQKELQLHKQVQVVLQTHEFVNPSPLFVQVKLNHQLFKDKYAYQFIKEINPPPPKSSC